MMTFTVSNIFTIICSIKNNEIIAAILMKFNHLIFILVQKKFTTSDV